MTLGLYLFSGARRAFDGAEWYICTTGFVMVVNGKGEALRWDQGEDFNWDTKSDNQHLAGCTLPPLRWEGVLSQLGWRR
jgi:hypothetical protein